MRETLDERLVAAHAKRDLVALSALYAEAADAAGNLDAECFFLTQAYVCALDAGGAQAENLRARLVVHGREER